MGTNSLPGDASTFPSPPLPFAQDIPLDRVLSGTVTYVENSGFGFNFALPRSFYGIDCFACFYFGGPGGCDTDPPNPYAGAFAVQLRGSGAATVYERTGPVNWAARWTFNWAEPYQVAGGHHTIGVIPYARDRILFVSRGTPFGLTNMMQVATVLSNRSAYAAANTNLYLETKEMSGHQHLRCMTGMGTIRLDWRRDLRTPFSIFRMKYPATGNLLDNTFVVPYVLAAGTAIQIVPDAYSGSVGAIVASLYDATTGAALTRIADAPAEAVGGGSFASVAGQQKYYALFQFTSGSLGYQTPALFGYRVRVAGQTVLNTSTAVTSKLRSASITGPDIRPDHETASCTIHDTNGTLTPLRQRDRIYARLKVNVPAAEDARGYFIAFEGETAKPVANRRVKEGRQWPGTSYVAYEPLRLVGMWARLADQFAFGMRDFRQDDPGLHPGVTRDPRSGEFPPWKITDIIKFLLQQAGVPNDEIDVPDDPLRLWPSTGKQSDDHLLNTGASYAELLAKFSSGYLGRYLIRDYNVGPVGRGMWRLITPADELSTNVLWEFKLGTVAGRVPTRPGAYGAKKSFITSRSYNTWMQPPEANYLVVTATGQIPAGGATPDRLTCVRINPDSYDWDGTGRTVNPANPGDWLGRRVPLVVFDPFLTTPEAVNYITCRLYYQACESRRWVNFQAPFVNVNDTQDTLLGARTRPLRVGDLVRVGGTANTAGRRAMIRSANADWKSDRAQMAFYEALFLEA